MNYDQKRIRFDNDYETNFYSSSNNYYQNEHPYHHTSVIVDSQQYFLNGWNGTTAF
jgi:hypothetical protein